MSITSDKRGTSPLLIIGTIALVAVIAGAAYLMTRQPATAPSATETAPIETTEPTTSISPTLSNEQGDIKAFTIAGSPFAFSPNKISVKKGDTVRINFTNTQGFHDLTVDGYNVKTKQINAGQSEIVEFVANKAGIFKFYCSVGTHEEQGMVGSLTVE